jgi:hypothetical protein
MSAFYNEEMKRIWMKANNLRLTKTPAPNICWRKIAGMNRKDCPYKGFPYCRYGCEVHIKFPFKDHTEVFRHKATGEYWVIFHPYSVDGAEEEGAKVLQNGFGLKVEIHDRDKSWYYPGKSYLVIIRKAEEAKS